MVIREILEAWDREIAAHKAAILRIEGLKSRVLEVCKPKADEAYDADGQEGPAIAGRIGCHDEPSLPLRSRKRKAA